MPITPPDGFLTRPEAAKIYNRSQRALERDITKALAVQDERGLAPWKLITKDGEVRSATDVTPEHVEELVNEGMVPTWCVEAAWLEETYGRKGKPKPVKSSTHQGASDHSSQSQHASDSIDVESGGVEPTPKPLPSDLEFLKDLVRSLEHEKREEAERNERREAKLFAELDVKNKQIAAWDEISQGLTKALATGQITPTLLNAKNPESPTTKSTPNQPPATPEHVIEADEINEVSAASPAEPKSPKKGTRQRKTSPKKSTNTQPKSIFEKHTPTFHRLFKRKS